MLLDAASLYFRAFYGVPTSITAPDGSPINAVRGFLDMTSTLVTRYRPTRLVACLDESWRPAWRVALVPSYKAHRVAGEPDEEEVPDELAPQVPVLLEVLAAVGIATAGAADYEADDIIGTLATRGPGPVDVVTGDRDLIQLIDDASGVRVLYTGRGVAKLEEMDAAAVRAKYGVEPSQYADFATLRGDPSDGLPGVAGIGEKTAAGLLGRFGDLAGLLAAVDARNPALPAAQWRRLDAAREYLAVAPEVVKVAHNAPVPTVSDALPEAPVDPERVAALAERYGLESAIGRLTKALVR
ncbi:5'-3' exonuclease [Cryptosporangium aurantiacum]|uniref:5'-3' exonuclease n=1 Tax=Cryptosporangium aurantiacum TaxID=134849 RepID=A0A1M7RIB8_9ACTN|nr:5'-3' exonuclease [Cryptosporangium aurantiacum]